MQLTQAPLTGAMTWYTGAAGRNTTVADSKDAGQAHRDPDLCLARARSCMCTGPCGLGLLPLLGVAIGLSWSSLINAEDVPRALVFGGTHHACGCRVVATSSESGVESG